MQRMFIIFGTWATASLIWTLLSIRLLVGTLSMDALIELDSVMISALVICIIVPISMFFMIAVLFNFYSIQKQTLRLLFNMHNSSKHQMDILQQLGMAFIEFKHQTSADSFMRNIDLIYHDLLQHLIPIADSVSVVARSSKEHPLWQVAGGLVDAYNKNPHVLEQLRRQLKWDESYQQHVELFLKHANQLLEKLGEYDRDGLLLQTFNEGLMGQIMALLTQAQNLAMDSGLKTPAATQSSSQKSVLSILGQKSPASPSLLDEDLLEPDNA